MVMVSEMQNISFVKFSKLYNWSVQYLLDEQFSYNNDFPLVRIGSFLKRNKTPILIKNGKEYKRVTIKTNNGGVYLRDIEKGDKIGTKKQFIIKEGQFIVSKIDARNGAFGVVTNEVDNAIITGNFWTFDVDYDLINPHYLSLITTTPEFIRFCEKSSTGTTNRHYLQQDLFLEVEIPLPPLNEEDAKKRGLSTEVTQEKLVADYNRKIKEAEEAQQKAQQKEAEIETYLYNQLGIQKAEKKELKKGLNFVRFKDIDRWDALEQSIGIVRQLYNAKYPVNSIGKSFEIVKRSWNKKKSENEYFYYVELGAIDPNIGILSSKKVKVNKAPSRASQTIKKGDFILGTTRPYLKKFAIVTDEYNNNVCSSGFAVFKPNNKEYNLVYLKEVLMSDIGTEQFKNKMTGALYPAITNSQLREVKIPFPTPEIQSEIANTITIKRDQIKSLNNHSQILKQQAIKDFESIIFQTESK